MQIRRLFDGPPEDPVQDIGILVLPGFSNLTLAGAVEPLRAANRIAGQTLYRWRVLSTDGAPVTSSSRLQMAVDGRFDPEDPVPVLFVVASYNAESHATRDLIAALRALRLRGSQFGGFESGSYVLARAGLLDGYRATTHWEDLEDFAERFPRIDVVPDRFVIDRDRFTTGGATPALDLALHLIRVQHGYSLALEVAGTFIYEQERESADPQRIVSLGRLRWHNPSLARAIALMEAHVETPLKITEVARRSGTGIRELQRSFATTFGTSPLGYYRDLRLNMARRLLLQSRHDIADVAVKSGFGSGSAFARAFRAKFGRSPSAARTLG